MLNITIIATLSIFSMVIFPPFQGVLNGRVINFGYSFLFLPPFEYATVNVTFLILQCSVVIIASGLWYLHRKNF
ncbi:hypothetical protein L0B53_15650 [Vibrio sp. SS-MA-C1-2]|uniref:hypothetical protein n=1 Tax=Vibrio sp. SS-MA-C1-2 TaxID=2908646 RepID=UPI001F19123B|nr:hypothetical protein [Vibrio sp. SS-MA-C1-2]UJF18441.1 hypothetical protein L0B53_15650 [Vibrio sp. SS-MA-C1-2]